MIQTLKKIMCDECMRRFSQGSAGTAALLLDANTALEQAERLGWYLDGDTELCPLHAKEERR